MARTSEQKNALARVVVALGVVASYVCPALSKVYPVTIPHCPRPKPDDYWLRPNNATKYMKVEMFYHPVNHYHRALADLLGTMIKNALAVEVVPVDRPTILAECEGREKVQQCFAHTFEEHRDIDPMSSFFEPDIFFEDEWERVDALPTRPTCYENTNNVFMRRSVIDNEQMNNNKSYCPNGVFFRGFNRVFTQFGFFVTPAAVDLLRGYHTNKTAFPLTTDQQHMPIFYRDLYNSSWLSNFAKPNSTAVEIDQQSNQGMGNDFFDLYFKIAKAEPFYYVPPYCQKVGVDKCYVLYKSLIINDPAGIVEGLLTTYNLPFIVHFITGPHYKQLLRDYVSLGPTLLHGQGPNDHGEGVMKEIQRIQFPSCTEAFAGGPDGTFKARSCDWPERITAKMASSQLWWDLPVVMPFLDALVLDVEDIDTIQASSQGLMYGTREAALCHYAQDLIDKNLKAFLKTCSRADQKVDMQAESCYFNCNDGEVPVFVGEDRIPVCECAPGWALKTYSPNVLDIFNDTVDKILAQQADVGTFVLWTEYIRFLGKFPCIQEEAGSFSCIRPDDVLQYNGQCYPCPPGKVCLGGLEAPQACVGEYLTSHTGASSQTDCICQIGAYRDSTANRRDGSACTLCPEGRYKDIAGNDDCEGKCPLRTTSFEGAQLLEMCLCSEGNYMLSLFDPYECATCPVGGICRGKEISVPDAVIPAYLRADYQAVRIAQGLPYARKGWHGYQDTVFPPAIRNVSYLPKFSKCPLHASCLEGGTCGEGTSGYLCSECPVGYGRGEVYPIPCDKCYYYTISSMLHWLGLNIFCAFVTVALVKIVQACYGNSAMYAIAVLKMIYDHMELIHAAGMSTTASNIRDFQEWPAGEFAWFSSETYVWIMEKLMWPVITFCARNRGAWTIGPSTQVFYCILDQHPKWIMGPYSWEHSARVEYTRLVMLLFSVPATYLLIMTVWFPIYVLTVKSRKTKLELVQTKMWQESMLRGIAADSTLNLGNVPRDLGIYATMLRRKNEVYIWQAASDDYEATHKQMSHLRQSYNSTLAKSVSANHVSTRKKRHRAAIAVHKANNAPWVLILKRYIYDSWPIVLVILYWLYPVVNRHFLAALLCSSWPSSKGGYTEDEYESRVPFAGSIQCGSEAHSKFMMPAAFGLVIYGLGPPLMIVMAIRNLEFFTEKKKRLWAFHLHGYDLSTVGRYWDAVRFLRTLVLWTINVWATTNEKLFLTLGWCGTFSYLQAQFHPFTISKNNILNRLELVSLFGSQSQVFLYVLSHVKMSPLMGMMVLTIPGLVHVQFGRMALGLLWDDATVFVEYWRRRENAAILKAKHVVRGSKKKVIEGMPPTGDPITAKDLADQRDAHGEDSSSSSSHGGEVEEGDETDGVLTYAISVSFWLWRIIRFKYEVCGDFMSCIASLTVKFVKLLIFLIRPLLLFEEATHVTVDINKAELHVIGQFRRPKKQKRKGDNGHKIVATSSRGHDIELDRHGNLKADSAHKVAPSFVFDHEKRSKKKKTFCQTLRKIVFKPHKAFAPEKEDHHNVVVGYSLNLMRSHFQSFLETSELAGVPLNWFAKILEEACRTKVEKPTVKLISELIEHIQKERAQASGSMGGDEYRMVLEQKLFSLADEHVSRAQRRKWFMLFSLNELNRKIEMAQGDNPAYFLDHFMRICFMRSPATTRDVGCTPEWQMPIQFSPAKAFPEPVISALDMEKEEVETTRTVSTVRSVDILLGKAHKDDIAHWDLLHGVPSEERGQLDDRIHRMRQNFNSKMATWVKNVQPIENHMARYEGKLERRFYNELKPLDCNGPCIEHGEVHFEQAENLDEEIEEAVAEELEEETHKQSAHKEHFWALPKHFPPPGLKVLSKIRDAQPVKVNLLHRAKKLLIYDLDPQYSHYLLSELDQRLKQEADGWQKSHVHWLCASGVAPLRWLHAGLNATFNLVSYTTASELEVLYKHQRARITEPYMEEDIGVQLPFAVISGESDVSFNDCLLHRFLQRQWIMRHERVHMPYHQRVDDQNLQEIPGGFDDVFLRKAIRGISAEEQMTVIDTINAWRRSFALFEVDFIFGKALEFQLFDQRLNTKLGLPYTYARQEEVSFPEICAVRYPMTTCNGEPNPECKPALGSLLPRDDRQTVWDALRGGNLDHAMQVVERKMEEKTWLAQQEAKKHEGDIEDWAVNTIRDELDAWITWVQLWFARAVFTSKPNKGNTYLQTAMADMKAKVDEYYFTKTIDYETKEEIEQHLQRYPNSSWIVDIFMEIEAEASWKRETKILAAGQVTMVKKDLSDWFGSRIDELKEREPSIKRTKKGVPYVVYDPHKEPEMPRMRTMREQASQVNERALIDKAQLKDVECTAALERKLDESQWKAVQTKIEKVEKEMMLQQQSLDSTQKDRDFASTVAERFKKILHGLATFDTGNGFDPDVEAAISASPPEANDKRQAREIYVEYLQEIMMFGHARSDLRSAAHKPKINLAAGLIPIDPGEEQPDLAEEAEEMVQNVFGNMMSAFGSQDASARSSISAFSSMLGYKE